MTFLQKQLARLKAAGNGDVIPAKKPAPVVKEAPPMLPRFNIHKRSLPVGIDKIVVFNVTKPQAERLLSSAVDSAGGLLFATRSYYDAVKESKTLIYFDVVPVDATPSERSIFYNPAKVVEE